MAEIVTGEVLNAMDTLFNAWLAQSNMVSKDGFIYQGTGDGNIKLDQQGNPMVVPAETLKKMLSGDGFPAYVKKHNPGVELVMKEHPSEKQ